MTAKKSTTRKASKRYTKAEQAHHEAGVAAFKLYAPSLLEKLGPDVRFESIDAPKKSRKRKARPSRSNTAFLIATGLTIFAAALRAA